MTWQLHISYKPTLIQLHTDMPSKKTSNSSCFRTVIITLLLFLCISLSGLFAALELLPKTASREFGPAARSLDPFSQAFYSARLLLQKDDLLVPVDLNGSSRTFKILNGDTVNIIALHLEDAGLIRDAGAFRLYLIYAGTDTNMQAGDFRLSSAQNAIQIAKTLQDANAKEISFRVLAGWRIEEVAAGLAVSGLQVKPNDFIQEIEKPTLGVIPTSLNQIPYLEGFLFPDTYKFTRTASIPEILATFTRQFDQQVNDELKQAFQRQGLDLYQAVTLASIVQREAVVADEQPMIASVFYNRLRKPMKLDSDPTVQYAVGYNSAQQTWWTNPLSIKDLQIDSPYNTYIRIGLPPGPIASPGLSALRAVAYPAQSPYFYFQAKCDKSGTHSFAVTYDEHLKNSCP
jgi:UPF0755 protein